MSQIQRDLEEVAALSPWLLYNYVSVLVIVLGDI